MTLTRFMRNYMRNL